ncbi:MAG: ABC transporter permease [Lachnospiraceae bacterium]|nr:ABC transporter permease [Lachnospiraceae bacterium]
MRENIIEALHEIWMHKMRSFLTMLGVIIGIASIIAIVSTIKGTNDQIMENLVGKGNNNVEISLMQGDMEFEFDGYTGMPQGVTLITDDQKERIREISHVVDASFFYSRVYADNIYRGQVRLDGARVFGVDDHFLNTYGYYIYRGRHFIKEDRKQYRKVVLLDSTAAEILFNGQDPIGETIEISEEPFVVVGLFDEKKRFTPDIKTLDDYETYFEDSYGTVLLPDACWPIVYNFDEPQNAYVRADRTENMSVAGREAQQIMRESITKAASKNTTYKAGDMTQEARNQQQLQSSTNSLLIWVASIALLVGGIGVMNIMLVSVTERTREIGLKRSLGAKRMRIMMQFLTESAVLTLLGGIFGIITGIILAGMISKITRIPVGISIPAIIISVVFSVVIGIVFGLIPSIKASQLSPIEALRRE